MNRKNAGPKRLISTAGFLLALLLVLAGCGGSATPTKAPPRSPRPKTPVAQATAVAPTALPVEPTAFIPEATATAPLETHVTVTLTETMRVEWNLPIALLRSAEVRPNGETILVRRSTLPPEEYVTMTLQLDPADVAMLNQAFFDARFSELDSAYHYSCNRMSAQNRPALKLTYGAHEVSTCAFLLPDGVPPDDDKRVEDRLVALARLLDEMLLRHKDQLPDQKPFQVMTP